ncbi:MAG: hypothetical protein JXQ81_12115 [Desulfuromonadales bacterium]|nr:hypothetical protein [Desulfuromonadales bacterium]MBN2793244.1 hypothetical protein [Desulfuromonadales bacterium]
MSQEHAPQESPAEEKAKAQPISFFGTIITALIISVVVSAMTVSYYHQRYAPKFLFFNLEAYNQDIANRLKSGELVRENVGLELANLKARIDQLPHGAIVFREDVVLSEIDELKK